MKKITLSLLATVIYISFATAQVFSGFEAYKRLMEYEAQRYLMAEIFEIPSDEPIEIEIKRVFNYENGDEGFIISVVAFKIGGQKGAVISAFNSTSLSNDQYRFVNLHLSDEEMLVMHQEMMDLVEQNNAPYQKVLKHFNSRIILEASIQIRGGREFPACGLWIDQHTRHTFLESDWEDFIKAYQSF